MARKRNLPLDVYLVPGELIASNRVPGEVWAMLNCYVKWLNMVHEDLGEDCYEPVGVEDFWIYSENEGPVERAIHRAGVEQGIELEGTFDGPKTILDVREIQYGGSLVSLGTRLIQISCTPFHDEGGHARLTAGFQLVKVEEDGHPGPITKDWVLDWMVAWFDCQTDLVVSDGEVTWKVV